MESIAVTKPNMTVTRQDALSPFGLLTALFTEEVARRNSRSPGFYRAMPLAYLEESEREALPSPPEVHIELNIDLLLNRLLKEAREREKNEKKPQTPPERILERVVVREREIRTAYAETRRVVIETGGKKYNANLPVRASEQIPERVKNSRVVGETRVEREVSRPGENSSPAAADTQKRAGSPSKLLSAVGTAKPVRAGITPGSKRADRTLPLASQMLSAPSAGGWTPQQRELHPGYPVRSETKQAGGLSAGSILLPDVLRRRREEAIAQSETRGAIVSDPEDYGAVGDALEWSADGTEQNFETERILREVRRAVDKTLRRNALRGDEASTQTEKRGERREIPIRSSDTGSQRENSDSYTRARAHANETPGKETGHEARSVPGTHDYAASPPASETERDAGRAAPAAAAQSTDVIPASPSRGTAASGNSDAETAETSERAAASEQVYKQPAFPTGTAAPEEINTFTAVPTEEETDISPELVFREDVKEETRETAERADAKEIVPQTAVGREAETTAQAKPETAIPTAIRPISPEEEASAELTYREDAGTTKEIVPQTASGRKAETSAEAKPETAIPTAIRPISPEEKATAELTYRKDADTEETVPQSITGREAETPLQAKPETAIPTAIRPESPEKEAFAELTYRKDADMEETVPQGITGREAETPLQAKPETAIPTAIRSGSPEEEVSAELTYRKDADTKEIAPQTVTSREAETPLQAKPETAIPTAIRPESPEEEASAELTYREDADAKEIVPQTASGREAEAPAQTKPEIAIPTAIRPISPEEEATAKLTYREDADGNVLHTAERADTKQTAPQTVTGREAEAPAQAKPETAIPTAIRPIFQEEEATTELTYREDAERNAAHSADRTEAPDIEPTERRADVRTQTTARRDTAIPAAIPSENPEAETPAELTYREKTEEGVRQRAESQTAQAPAPHTPVRTEAGESDRMRPEAAIPAAIPSANPETAVPAELTYRESTETNADQSASPHTDGTTGRKTAAQQFRTPFPQRGESHRAEPQIGETVLSKKGTGQTVREIRVTSEHGLRQPGAARSGKQSAEQTEQGAQKTQDRDVDRIALPVGEEIDGVRPPELFFTAPAASEQPPADPTAQRPAQPAQSDKTNELPKWAKELLDEAGVSQNEQRFALFNRDSGSPSARQISWTAPAAAPQQSVVNGRTELSFKENREAEQLPNRQMIGDAEIQRTADRIYKIIEERLRRELRRSGR